MGPVAWRLGADGARRLAEARWRELSFRAERLGQEAASADARWLEAAARDLKAAARQAGNAALVEGAEQLQRAARLDHLTEARLHAARIAELAVQAQSDGQQRRRDSA